jgi:hypothetical protein
MRVIVRTAVQAAALVVVLGLYLLVVTRGRPMDWVSW